MRKIINRRVYDTDTAKQLSFKYVGKFGETHGYEERMYLTEKGLYFIFGVGGSDSPYPKESIKPITKEQADEWAAEISESEEPVGKTKKAGKNTKEKDTKSKATRKPPV